MSICDTLLLSLHRRWCILISNIGQFVRVKKLLIDRISAVKFNLQSRILMGVTRDEAWLMNDEEVTASKDRSIESQQRQQLHEGGAMHGQPRA